MQQFRGPAGIASAGPLHRRFVPNHSSSRLLTRPVTPNGKSGYT